MDFIHLLMGCQSQFDLVSCILIKDGNVGYMDIESCLGNLDISKLFFTYWN